ncbi:hypothetical protein SAMN05443575_2418 [Jatrophihabitans endophyticus]|uniref:Uncharacterized protein n=1 Tax=Jatrophihabitans endophyticus TaxID=1206085 RepID=A0A1M5LCZ9_9ACTN|nr:hypothetical protein [Jatrophihabitans endophyticus]SHG62982.1 hypothetical protein SAMN05443575_2418 [Jatrophihabitans endophyticus]
MEPPLPARRADEPDEPFGDARPAYDVGEFPQGSPFSRWALARYVIGRVLLDRVSWSLLGIGVTLVVLAVCARFLLHSTLLAVLLGIVAVMVLLMRALLRAVLRRLMGSKVYGPLEDRLGELVLGATNDVFGELNRVGLPSRTITLPLLAFRLVGRRRKDTMARLRQFQVERAVSRARLDELHMLLREGTGRGPGAAPGRST